MASEVLRQLRESGYEGRFVSTEHLPDLQEEFEGRHRRRSIDEDVYQAYMTGFTFHPPKSLPDARSIIVVAVPHPQFQVTFTWAGGEVQSIVPPTYLWGHRVDGQVHDLLAQTLEPEGYRVAEAFVPKKLLAVRSGLAAYGKNNISYVPGKGSFHRLAAFYSNLPCQEDARQGDSWQEPQMLDRCQKCSACLQRCPAGAITPERFLLHAERCITFHNEKDSAVPFPRWLDRSWHNCLVGCMHCQLVCPANKDVRRWVEEGPAFSEEETALLLQGTALGQLPAETAEKLAQSEMAGFLEVLPRNLRTVLGIRVG
jgi:epoxyqueuosine reductase